MKIYVWRGFKVWSGLDDGSKSDLRLSCNLNRYPVGYLFQSQRFCFLINTIKIKTTKTLHVGYKNKQIKQTKNKMGMAQEVLAGSFKERSKGRKSYVSTSPITTD